MGQSAQAERSWQHPWLRIERMLRLLIGRQMSHEPSDERDKTLAAVIERRQEIEREGWFN